MPTQGSCLCGAVAFEIETPLSEIELCHCRKCRKAYSAPFAATLYTQRDGFRWQRGADLVGVYDAPIESAPPAYRHSFCRRCGGGLPLLWDAMPFVEVPVACLDSDAEARPVYQMFRSQCLAWIDDLPSVAWHDRGVPLHQKVLAAILRQEPA